MVKIHIEVSDETRRKLRVRAALDDQTVQDLVSGLIENHVRGLKLPNTGSRTT